MCACACACTALWAVCVGPPFMGCSQQPMDKIPSPPIGTPHAGICPGRAWSEPNTSCPPAAPERSQATRRCRWWRPGCAPSTSPAGRCARLAPFWRARGRLSRPARPGPPGPWPSGASSAEGGWGAGTGFDPAPLGAPCRGAAHPLPPTPELCPNLPPRASPAPAVSSRQVAADANTAAQTYPDQSLYPADSVPKVVERINNVRGGTGARGGRRECTPAQGLTARRAHAGRQICPSHPRLRACRPARPLTLPPPAPFAAPARPAPRPSSARTRSRTRRARPTSTGLRPSWRTPRRALAAT
jgi:hypothetical protein